MIVSPLQGSGYLVGWNPGRCPGLVCFAPLGLWTWVVGRKGLEAPFSLLASLALSPVHHGIKGADHFFLGSEFAFRGGGGEVGGGGGGGLGGHDAALVFLHGDGGFLDVGGLEGAEVVGGFESFVPGAAIHVAEHLEVRGGEEEVDRLRLVDPLLAAGGGIDDVLVFDAEDGLVLVLDGLRDVVDGVELAVEVFELVHHFRAPEAGFLEVAD